MKKTLSILLAALMIFSCLSFSSTAFANTQQTAEIIKLDETKSFQMSQSVVDKYGDTKIEHYYYFRFVPETTGFYKFTLKSSSTSAYDIKMRMLDYTNTDVCSTNFNYATGECSMIYRENLIANKQYIIEVENDSSNNTVADCTLTVNAHTHNFYVEYSKSSTLYDDGYIDYDCTDCRYYEIVPIPQLKSIDVKNTKFIYNSKSQTPTITISDVQGKVLTLGTDYDLTYPTGNTKPGKHIAKLTLKNNYSGDEEFEFVILPKSTTLSKVTKAKKSAKVSWKKDTTVTGYEIQYSTKKNFKGAKKVTIKGNKKTSTTIKKLSSNKKYYFRVRTYKTSDYKNYYSSWSKSKSVKVK